MPRLSNDDVLKLAKLARLHLTEAEVQLFADEIAAILGYVEQLQSIDLEGIEPTFQVTGLTNVTRSDKVIDYGTTPQDLLKNAPAIENGHIKVRRML
jgi:aspartyl-tRNA(Asn)/glutamyl-tRNA(Gln) amidotransferase subunit C